MFGREGRPIVAPGKGCPASCADDDMVGRRSEDRLSPRRRGPLARMLGPGTFDLAGPLDLEAAIVSSAPAVGTSLPVDSRVQMWFGIKPGEACNP